MSHSGLCRSVLCRSVLCRLVLCHSALCRILGYVVQHNVHSALCRIRHYVAFGIMSFGIVLFAVKSFGLLSVYLVHSVIKTIFCKTFGDQKLFSVTLSQCNYTGVELKLHCTNAQSDIGLLNYCALN